MSNKVPFLLLFQEMLEKKEFSTVPQYDKEDVVSVLSDKEKELLALLMIRHAEKLFTVNFQEVEHCINRAKKIAPKSKNVILEAAHLYASHTKNFIALQKGFQLYSEAALKFPEDPDIALFSVSVLIHLDRLQEDPSLLIEANNLLDIATKLLSNNPVSREPTLSWLKAQVLCRQAHYSGEASEYSHAIDYYRKAATYDVKIPFFWNDYANAIIELGRLIKRTEGFEIAIELYRKAISLDPRYFSAQFNLGVCYQRLYEMTWGNNLFWNAHEQYSHCYILQNKHPTLEYAWGRLLLAQGKIRKDLDLLRQACHHLEEAAVTNADNTAIAVQLSEAFIWCGGISEELSMIRHAESTLKKLLDADPGNYEAYCAMGFCQFELGYYFSELSWVKEAVNHYSNAIKIDRANMKAWYGLAICTQAIAELENNEPLLQKALEYFAQAAEFDGLFFPQFWNDWGVAAMRAAEWTLSIDLLDVALEKFEQAIDLDLRMSDGEYVDPDWLYNYGCAFDFMGDILEDASYYEKAIQVLSRVIEISPDHNQAKYNLAVAFAHLGECVDEIEALYKACSLFKELITIEHEDELIWNEWGLCLIHIAQLVQEPAKPINAYQHLAEAEGKFLHALTLGHLPAYYNLACVYSLLDDPKASIAFLEKANANRVMPSKDEVLHDEWLEGVRSTEEFRLFWSDFLSKYPNPDF